MSQTTNGTDYWIIRPRLREDKLARMMTTEGRRRFLVTVADNPEAVRAALSRRSS